MQKELPFKETLLVSDMDGTLITDKFEMPERNIEAVRLFIEGGGHFAFSTGRTVFSAGAFFDRVRVNAPCILYNGAVLFDYSKAEFLWSADLPESVFELCSAAIQRFPDLGAEVMTDDAVYIIQVNVSTRRHIINESIHYLMRDLADVPRTGAHKIIFTGEADELQQALQFVERQPNGGWDFVFSSPNFLEILPQNVSKGTTLV
ncbi:MAG TPA: hypothetical protein DEP42_07375, partial [Ruminococcaceae bacterium]|nr:hypothetical protein [Oscillospiraceae bacterium]